MAEYYSYSQIKCPYCGKPYIKFDNDLCACKECLYQNESINFSVREVPPQELIDKTAAYVAYHDFEHEHYFIGSIEEYERIKSVLRNGYYRFTNVTKDEVESWYPRTFAQKIDYILLYFAEHMKYNGEAVPYTLQMLKSIFFAKTANVPDNDVSETKQQVVYILNYLCEENYIKPKSVKKDGGVYFSNPNVQMSDCEFITLTPKALARVDELQKDISNNKDVFVAMSFHDTEDIREAIRQGILDAGFSDKFIDEIIHNQQIVPYMMRLIRECRFLIMDITDPNYGAYYEAGYALGLGKEVIITCSKEIFSKKDFANKLEEKALKPHFDIAQKQILVWENTADLTKQLKELILELSTRKR